MSVEVPATQSQSPAKKDKKQRKEEEEKKRKHTVLELDSAADIVPNSQPTPGSPTKKAKHKSGLPARVSHNQSQSHSRSRPQTLGTDAVDSPFTQHTLSLYLPISPICQSYPLAGLCAEHVSPLIMTYHPPLAGVIMSYKDPRLSAGAPTSPDVPAAEDSEPTPTIYAKVVDEYAVNYVWLTAEFLVFAPRRGGSIEGYINMQSETHIGLVVWNMFSAHIRKERIPLDWRWIQGGHSVKGRKRKQKRPLKSAGDQDVNGMDEDGEEQGEHERNEEEDHGHYMDGEGKNVEGAVSFRIVDFEAVTSYDKEKNFVSIRGTMLDEEEEEALLAREKEIYDSSRKSKRLGKKASRNKMSPAAARPTGEAINVHNVG